MQLSSRHKRLLSWVGYPLLALFTFLVTVSYTFPYDRLKDVLVHKLGENYDVSIASVGPTLIPGGITIESMMLETRPEKDGDEPLTVVVDELTADVGFLGLLAGTIDVEFEVALGGGTIEGTVALGGGDLEAELHTDKLPLENLPWVKEAIGLPMSGGLNADVELELPGMKWSRAEGYLALSCPECTVGDGEAKIKPPSRGGRYRRRNLFAQGGLTVPRLNLGDLNAQMVIEDGVGTIDEFSAKSPDGELYVDGEISFSDPVKQSTIPGCLRFKLSESFRKREPKFGNIGMTLPPRARQDGGFYALPTKGTIARFQFDPRRTCHAGPGGGGGDSADGDRKRPSITLRPDEDRSAAGDDAPRADREPRGEEDGEAEEIAREEPPAETSDDAEDADADGSDAGAADEGEPSAADSEPADDVLIRREDGEGESGEEPLPGDEEPPPEDEEPLPEGEEPLPEDEEPPLDEDIEREGEPPYEDDGYDEEYQEDY